MGAAVVPIDDSFILPPAVMSALKASLGTPNGPMPHGQTPPYQDLIAFEDRYGIPQDRRVSRFYAPPIPAGGQVAQGAPQVPYDQLVADIFGHNVAAAIQADEAAFMALHQAMMQLPAL